MAEISQEMILDYMIRKGGLVKNVDLVKHFRKFLQVDDAQQKDRAREIFKERVNTVAYIKAEKGEKYLHLRPEFQPVGSLSRPPTGRPSASLIEDNRYNYRSSTHKEPFVSDNRSSLASPISLTSPTSTSSGSEFSDPRTGSVAMSSRKDVVLNSYKPVSSPPPQTTSVVSSHTPQQNSAPSYTSSKPSGSVFSPPSSSLGGGLGGDDFGLSLLAELDSFGTLFESFGTGTSNSSSSKANQPTNSSLSSYETGSGSGLSKSDQTTKPSLSSYGAGSNSSLTKTDRTTKPGLSAYGSGSNSSLPKTDQTSSTLGYGSKPNQPNASGYAANSSSSSSTYGSGYGQTTKWSSPTHSGTSSVSKPTNMSPAQNSTYKITSSSSSLQSGTSLSRNGPTESAGDLSDLLSAFGSTSTTTTKYTPNTSYSSTSRKTDSAGDLSELLSTFGSTSLSSTTKTQSPSPKRPAPRAPPAAYQNKTSQAPQQKAAPITPSSSRGGSSSQLNEQQPSSSGPSTPKTSLGNLRGYHQPSTPPKRPAPGIPTTGTASPKTSSSSLGSASQPRSQLTSGDYGTPIGSSSPATRVQPASTTNYSTNRDSYQQRQQPPRQVTPPRSSFTSPPPQSTTNMNLSSGSLGAQTKYTSTSGSQLSTNTATSTANKTSDYSSTLGFFDMDLMSTFNTFGVGTSSITAPKGGSSSSPPKKLGPTVVTSTMNGGVVSGHRRVGSTDASSRRQGSMDMNTSTPSIRVESPTRSSESSSPGGLGSPRHNGAESRGRSPTYTAFGPGPGLGDTRGHTHSAVGSTDSLPLAGGVVLRNKDGKKVVGGSAAVRRSRNFDKNANLENMTRLSITMSTPPAARRNKGQLPPPDVAPKPFNREVLPARSREDIALEGDDVGSITEISEQDDYWEIDPLEKEWMLAAAQANVDDIHRLIMTDSYLVNRKDFIHGYTALHWAAKHGRCDIITMLIMSGAMVDIKSGGLTPLHLAAQSGHNNAIHLLIKEHGASVDVREHGGRRPADMLHDRVSEKTKTILSKYNNHGLPTPMIKYRVEHLSTFSQPHHKVSSLDRSWSSVGDLIDRRIETDKKRASPKLRIRKSFSFKQKKLKEYSSPKKDYRRENKKQKKSARPLSEAVPYSYDV